jgi:hypothetical protein
MSAGTCAGASAAARNGINSTLLFMLSYYATARPDQVLRLDLLVVISHQAVADQHFE